MKPSTEIHGQNILLLGYGREGQSTHRFLGAQYPHITVSIADKNAVSPLGPVASVITGTGYLARLREFSTVIRSPGIPSHTPELTQYIRSGGWVTTGTNLFFSVFPGMTIGITGTKGKSTSSALIAHILRQKFSDVRLVGNIGTPMLDALDDVTANTIYVIELSSHQLEDCRYSPKIAVILNIVPEHLDYYKDFRMYQQAKSHIVKYQTSEDFVIYNPGHKASSNIAQRSKGQKYRFSLTKISNSECWIDNGKIVTVRRSRGDDGVSLSDVPLKGNLENVVAAVAVGSLVKISTKHIGEAIASFNALPHRLEPVGTYHGITFYNDSLATIPEATIHAMEALGSGVETLIAGGFDRGLDYAALGGYLATRKGLKNLILFPDTGRRIEEAVEKAVKAGPAARAKKELPIFTVTSMEEAVSLAYRHTSPGHTCLLSPASASFNLFRDYADRGEQFKHYVRQYGEAERHGS
ncbi:UDP-N-acetylmuramoyl-L-alanine--D-glutamate ligase [Patescibacteria group bacterium]|nr:UDP-N-acetylmuramoyl-L-alanine--D-glutamate ligase [Patescibacteria group bacterium]